MQAPPSTPATPQYQSFPEAGGDSNSLEKLKALRLPTLAHKSFLDVGCNEGFFCGYALHDGASRAVGLDASPLYIERARRRFPAAEFLCQSWDALPAAGFDVILLASSLHYAADQAALITRLMQLLNPDGTLVLELGVSTERCKQWVQVDRSMDVRSYPTWPLLSDILQHYAWKVIGNSVSQRGDPVPRHVLHITRRKPLVYLLMQASGSGKSSVAGSLLVPAGVPVISGDKVLTQIAAGHLEAPAELKALLGPDLDHTRLDDSYRKIFQAGLLIPLLQLWQATAGGGTFALDAYIPEERREEVVACMIAAGYLVVTLTMSGMTGLEPRGHRHSSAQNYFDGLQNPVMQHADHSPPALSRALPFSGTVGFVDSVTVDDRFVKVVGWAVQTNGVAAQWLDLCIDGVSAQHQHVAKFPRPDLQKRMQLNYDQVGFRITIPTPVTLVQSNLALRVEVYAGESAASATRLWSIPAHNVPDQLPF
ncbi:MAG: methyltransferase domain-containing protein [Gammaproteobacteria bacterium]